jgi:hypothetical protein
MHAEFGIEHLTLDEDSLRHRLVDKFRANDLSVLTESRLFSNPEWRNLVLFATKTPNYRMICFPEHDQQLQIYIEPVGGNILRACDSAWKGTHAALKEVKPKLASLKLVDTESGKEFLSATTGLGTELRRREVVTLLIVGGLTLAWLLAGVWTFAASDPLPFAGGTITGLVGGLVGLIYAGSDARRGTLRWHD